ncbi:glycosyltransferase [Aliivibrio fischeri]|uniref:glycosyltransferase family 2 protein n=1 Tax=Aliivibrio fischeri TaxID=668 RepID=UPI0012D856F7|nr:glycosyltransferase [Aliivibrio fischeri]MUK92240.1 glycosyltransferase [Aliivibrio fischeri]
MYISIILPVYNGGKYLEQAINSLLQQTHNQFELICIDDGSIDNSLSILKKYEEIDSRIIVLSRENKGLVFTLNEGIKTSKYRYIARMDADDICEPNRLKLQISEMKSKKLAIIGSSYSYIDNEGKKLGNRILPTRHSVISWLMDFGSPLCHPSVIFDKSILGKDLYYDDKYKHCEDYELWLRCRRLGYRFGNVKKILFNYRILDTSVSRLNDEQQKLTSADLIRSYCSFIRNTDEAEYLLYGRKKAKKFWLTVKISFRCFLSFKILQSIFVFFYLMK